MLKPDDTPKLVKALKADDSAVRYWAAMGLQMRGEKIVAKHRDALHSALNDKADSVRIAAAEALGVHGNDADVKAALPVLVKLADPRKNDVHVCLAALNALDEMGTKVTPVLDEILSWPKNVKNSSDGRASYGVTRLLASIKSHFAN